MRLLDLFCGAGGAAMGYHRAGFNEICGVDHRIQRNYPFRFIQGEVLEFLTSLNVENFDLIHASPPCQAYVDFNRNKDSKHPKIIEPLRKQLVAIGKPFVIENVDLAPLINPIMLCGTMFGLRVIRHRLFEFPTLATITPPCNHWGTVASGDFAAVYGRGGHGHRHGRGVRDVKAASGPDWNEAMGINWMTKSEMTQAIPPAYTQFLGERWLAQNGHESSS